MAKWIVIIRFFVGDSNLEPVLNFLGHTLGDALRLAKRLLKMSNFCAFVDWIEWVEVQSLMQRKDERDHQEQGRRSDRSHPGYQYERHVRQEA